jgi:hypothetical protein
MPLVLGLFGLIFAGVISFDKASQALITVLVAVIFSYLQGELSQASNSLELSGFFKR